MATVSSHPTAKRFQTAAANVNPYQTPTSVPGERKAVANAAAVPALHSDRAIGVATFLGGVVAGGILVARNNFLLGRNADGVMFLTGAVFWQAFLIGLALALPFALPGGISIMICLAHAFGMKFIAQQMFAEQYAEITAGRGQWGHWGLALLAIAIPLVTIFSIVVSVIAT